MAEGFFSGLVEGQQASQGQQLRSLAIEEGGIKVQSEAVALKQAQLMLKMQEQISKRMGQMNTGPVGSTGAPLEDQATSLANDYLSMAQMTEAFPEQSAKYATTAMDIMKGQADIGEKHYKRQQDDMQFASNLMEGVHDEQSFKAAALQAVTERPEMAQMYGGLLGKILTGEVPYKPETAKLIHDSAIKGVDQARIKLDELRGKEATARIDYLEHEKKAADARARAENALAAERERGGAKGGTIPSAAQYNAVMGLVNEEFAEPGVDPSVLRRKALQAAQRTRELSGPKGELMDLDTASRIAFQEAKARGDFKGIAKNPITAGSTANPLPLPSGKDPSVLKVGKYYTGQGGKVRQWLGATEGWGPVIDTTMKFDATDEEGQEYDEERTSPDDDEPARGPK